MKGYTGKVLWVDLATKTMEDEVVPDEIYEKFFSGIGLAEYFLYNRIPAGADALGPDNILAFTAGLLTGTGSVCTGRWMVAAKSPLTGGFGDANGGGMFAPAIKQCGYDAIFFKGISEKPVYLYVDNKGPQLKDASHVWGKDTVETEEILEKENYTVKRPRVAAIGQAGEKLSLISGVSTDRGRIAARSGIGAVMGSKKLKAVVLAGNKAIRCENPEDMKKISIELCDKMRKQNAPAFIPGSLTPLLGKLQGSAKDVAPADGFMAVMMMKKWGSTIANIMAIPWGDSPVKNWGGSMVDFPQKKFMPLNPDLMHKRETQKYHCYSCAMGCGSIVDTKDINGGVFSHTHKPEYETVCNFGTIMLNNNMDVVYYANELLNRAGMDTISAGMTIAFAIECYENGVLTKEDTDGLELKWGDATAIMRLLDKMVRREGIGDILADGTKKAVERIGEKAKPFAQHSGGQDIPHMIPGWIRCWALFTALMLLLRGIRPEEVEAMQGCIMGEKVSWAPVVTKYPKSEEYVPSDVEARKGMALMAYKQFTDGIGGCTFCILFGVQHYKLFEWVTACTGWNKTPDDYMEMGRRMVTLRHMFNIKHGVDPRTYRLTPRVAGDPPQPEGPNKGKTVLIEKVLNYYWKNMGYDELTGIPKKETIEALKLDKLCAAGEK